MLRVGLTGGIACGKSLVLRALSAHGFPTLDLDHVAHGLLAPSGTAFADVVASFGPAILRPDGTIDRKALGAIVFRNEAARLRLNAIVHPLVRAEELRWASDAQGRGSVLVTDAALLVETGVLLRFDRLVVVHCSPEEQLRRLQKRDGLREAEARARIDAQMPIGEKRSFGHMEVDTSGTEEDTVLRAQALAKSLEAVAASKAATRRVSPRRAAAGLLWGPPLGPGGLPPLQLVEEIGETGGLELERVRLLLRPPREGPWYRAGRDDPPSAETLGVPLVLYALGRGGPDPPYLASAARALAILTHASAEERAGACLWALLLQELALSETGLRGLEERWDGFWAAARQWGGAEPPASLRRTIPALRDAISAPARGDVLGGALGLLLGVEAAPADVERAVEAMQPAPGGGP
jgi:dephospho-CoA kinase